jgi:pyruvate kinase
VLFNTADETDKIRHTKIIGTIGPASESEEVLKNLILNGMNVARLNLSHGELDEHILRIQRIRSISKELNKAVGILLDIQGPKIRTGEVPGGPRTVKEGSRLCFCVNPVYVTEECIYIGYDRLLQDLKPGSTIFLDDGLLEFRVEEIQEHKVICQVLVTGELKARKGVTLPGVRVNLPALTDVDKEHIRFAVEQQVDFIAASFVRKAEHILEVKEQIALYQGTQQVIAKIENAEGIENIEEIVKVADGIMVARGDMGVELPPEDVPMVQKQIIQVCNRSGKPVITATQMLDSMARNPRPTRAEVTDVANAILDGTDAVMLSGETAVGKYPVKAIQVMHRIAIRAEESLKTCDSVKNTKQNRCNSVAEAIAQATYDVVNSLKVKAVLCSTQSGASARLVSKHRPDAIIVATTPYEYVKNQLSVVWGVQPFIVKKAENIDDMIGSAVDVAIENQIVNPGEKVAIVAGVQTGIKGSTDLLQVYTIPKDINQKTYRRIMER